MEIATASKATNSSPAGQPLPLPTSYRPLPDAVLKVVSDQTSQGLGTWINRYSEYVSQIAPHAPSNWHAGAALFLISTIVARRLRLDLSFGTIYPNVFMLWLGETGAWGKSTLITPCVGLLDDWADHLIAAFDSTPEAFISDRAGIRPSNLSTLPAEQIALYERQAPFSAQCSMVVDEMTALFEQMGRDYNAGMIEYLMKAFDCANSLKRSTRTGGWMAAKNLYMSLLGASTPEGIRPYLCDHKLWGKGFWGRFVFLAPESDWPEFLPAGRAVPVPSGLREELADLSDRLPDPRREQPALQCVVSDEVLGLSDTYRHALMVGLGRHLTEWIRGLYARLPALAFKVSLLLAAVEWDRGDVPTVDADRYRRAVSLVEQWRISDHRVVDRAIGSGRKPVADRIVRLLDDGEEGLTARDISKGLRDVDRAVIAETLDQLVDAKLVDRYRAGPSPKGGAPTDRYRLHE